MKETWVQIPLDPPIPEKAYLFVFASESNGCLELKKKFDRLYDLFDQDLFDQKVSEKHPVFQTAKIAEETGEAINLVFKLVGFRRENYDVKEVREKLGSELADVVITTFTCAKVCGIDLWKAVDKKLDVEIGRWREFGISTQ